jgi:HSP20 family molecular chaperone IbpA
MLKLRDWWGSLFSKKKNKSDNQHSIKIPVAGVRPNEVIRKSDEGIIVIESTQSVVIEEYERYRPWKAYNSFGFNRTIRLPEGVKINKIQTDFRDDGLELRW